MIRSFKSFLAAVVLAACSVGAAVAAPVLAVIGPATVAPGSTFKIDVTASDLNDLYGYQFDLRFDASLFQVQSVMEGSLLQAGGATLFDGGVFDNLSGSIGFVLGSLIGDGPGVSGSGVLASFSFSSIGIGQGNFSLENVLALDSTLADIDVGAQALQVSVVPEPATLCLFAAAFGGLLVARRRRKFGA